MEKELNLERDLYLEREVEMIGKQKVVKQNLQMTVGELIEILKEVPPECEVSYYDGSYECELTYLLICYNAKKVILGD